MLRWSILVFALAAGAMSAACGSIFQGEADGGTGIDARVLPRECDNDVPVGDFSSCYHDAACEILERCVGDFGSVPCGEIRFSGIFDKLEENVGDALFQDAVAAQTIVYDGVAAAQLIASYATAKCTSVFDGIDPLVKASVVDGLVTLGGACISDLECATDGGWCRRDSACESTGAVCCAGTCAAPSALGSQCAADRECGAGGTDGGYCVDLVCRSGTVGAQCNGAGQCAENHYCNGGVCAIDVPSGGACAANVQCPAPQRCVGTTLIPATGACALVQVVGEACDRVSSCNEGLYCLQPVPTALGTCQRLPQLGDSCLDSSTCGAYLHCDTQTSLCVDRGGSGDPCGPGLPACDQTGFCTNALTGQPSGVCTSKLADDQVCSVPRQCDGGICESGRCTSYESCSTF